VLDCGVLLTAWVSSCSIWVAVNIEMERISNEVGILSSYFNTAGRILEK
jgi:hypothetical protein